MFKISVETTFNASHQLSLPDGSKENLHDHNWQITACVSCEKLNKSGLVMDFHLLKQKLDSIIAKISNIQIEKNPDFSNKNASAENIAYYIYQNLQPALPSKITLEQVKVVEQPGCWATYSK